MQCQFLGTNTCKELLGFTWESGIQVHLGTLGMYIIDI